MTAPVTSPIFATAGLPVSFRGKYPRDLSDYLARFGLNGFEVQCGRGVRVNPQLANVDCQLSLHAPYFISLSSVEAEKRVNSVGYILESAVAADEIGARRVIVHSGSCAKISRESALALALETLQLARKTLDSNGLPHIVICPETMGKINQLGTLEEVIALCEFDERMLPCVDFGHLNSRTHGGLRTRADYAAIFALIADKLGETRLKNLHIHFSKQEFSRGQSGSKPGGGEKKHLTFAEGTRRGFGPEFEPLMDEIAARGMTPFIVCESDGTQAEDCAVMAAYHREICGGKERSLS
jgi:deoxyribonuclease-4